MLGKGSSPDCATYSSAGANPSEHHRFSKGMKSPVPQLRYFSALPREDEVLCLQYSFLNSYGPDNFGS